MVIKKMNDINDFAKWQQDQLDRRDWDELDLAVESSISEQTYEYGFCPCSKECKYYISKTEVHKTIKEFVQSRAYKGGRENETDLDQR